MYPYPMVAGHEGVGIVTVAGKRVTHIKVGSRVGLGVYRGCCNACLECNTGKSNLCAQKGMMFAAGHKGTFAEYVRIKAQFAFPIPDGFKDLEVVGPLMCAGVTTFAPFMNHNIRPGQKVAISGVGGLGHLAIQFARAFGCEVYALSSSADKRESILKLGAHFFVDTKKDPDLLTVTNRFDFIMATTSGPDVNWKAMMNSLAPGGNLILMGFPGFTDIGISPVSLILQQKTVCGSASGSAGAAIEMLRFAALHNITPQVEKFAFSEVNEVMNKVKNNQVRYRAVLCHSKK